MNNEDSKDLLFQHDKSIDKLTGSVEHLVISMTASSKKLDDVIDVITTQNVLLEKVNYIEENIKESFTRVHDKINGIETMINTTGCESSRRLQDSKPLYDEKIKVANKRIETLEASTIWISRTVIGALLTGSIATLFLFIKG